MKKLEQMSAAFTIRSEQDLTETFRKDDQEFVVFPEPQVFPVRIEHYLAWTDPDGRYAYMVFRKPEWETPRGLVFNRKDRGGFPATGRLCDWCHSYGSTNEIGMLTVTATPRRTVGLILCRDLSCINKIEDLANLAGKPAERMSNELCHRIARFFESLSKQSE